MIKKSALRFLLMFMVLFMASETAVMAQLNLKIEDFTYANNDSLKAHWRVFGFSSLDFGLVNEAATAPVDSQFLRYDYSGNAQTTWGGALEKKDLADAPINLTGYAGVQFLLKGDGTANNIYFQFMNGETAWSSQTFSLSDTSWHIVRVPFQLSETDGFKAEGRSFTDFTNDLKNVTSIRIFVDKPVIDNISRAIFIDEIYAAKFFPPQNSTALADFEQYRTTDEVKVDWQFFGFSTLDYNLKREPLNAPIGHKFIDYMYIGDNSTTWGGAIRSKNLGTKDLSASNGFMFYLKGDGSDNVFQFRFYAGLEMWSSYNISLKDTNWTLVKIPFAIDTTNALRYIGNNPDGPDFTLPPGTIEQLRTDLKTVTEVRFYVVSPIIDFTRRTIQLDALYAVDKFPPLPPVRMEDFESYSDNDALALNWQQFGDAGAGYTLTTHPDSVTSGSKAMVMKYQGIPGSQYSAVRRRNIIPGFNFASLNGGIQFWLKGDGTANTVRFRIYNGNEMWASHPVPLSSTEWRHAGIPFTADAAFGFRYLGNDQQNPNWDGEVGTTAQLYGDLGSIDQIRFEVLTPEGDNAVHSIVFDGIEGVDQLSPDIISDVKEIEGAVPSSFSMDQNYPNPFNPATVIRYNVPKAGLISLKVYNMLGQEVAELVNREHTAGTFEVNFNASKLSSGVYFYTLTSDNYSLTKKMLLLK